MIYYEDFVCKALGLPAIPKKEWDGTKSFKVGVGVIEMADGRECYGVVTFDSEKDEKPRVTKVFTLEQFVGVKQVFVVPEYMDEDVEHMDLDDESKDAAKRLLEEAKELENKGVNNEPKLPENEYFFDNIHDDDEGMAFIKDYNRRNKIRGKIPTTHEAIVMRLSVIYSEINKKSQKK